MTLSRQSGSREVVPRWLRRRRCRKGGHQFTHVSTDVGMCMASRSTCTYCGFQTWRYWEDSAPPNWYPQTNPRSAMSPDPVSVLRATNHEAGNGTRHTTKGGAMTPTMQEELSLELGRRGTSTRASARSLVPQTRRDLAMPPDDVSVDLGQSDSHRFIQARSMIRRMLEDWPYQPPEVIEPERAAFRRWLDETKPSPAEYMAALREEADYGA